MPPVRRISYAIISFSIFLFISCASDCNAQTRNVILMISDGQGIGTVMAADFYKGKKAVYENFSEK